MDSEKKQWVGDYAEGAMGTRNLRRYDKRKVTWRCILAETNRSPDT